MLKINGLGVNFLRKLSDDELQSGEEYEILFAFSPKNARFVSKMAQKFGLKLTIFGKAVKGKYEFKGKSWHFWVWKRFIVPFKGLKKQNEAKRKNLDIKKA